MDVALVYLPYGPLPRPSLAMSVLKSGLTSVGVSSQVFYLNLDFAERIGLPAYRILGYVREEMIGDWTFAGAAFPDFLGDPETYLAEVEKSFADPAVRAMLVRVREQAPAFIEEAARRVAAGNPRIVACSTTFNQNGAVLAFTRRIRELLPEAVLMVGGANCDGDMGLAMASNFPWLDLVVSGEADELFPKLCQTILKEGLEPIQQAPPRGVFPQGVPVALPAGRARVENLDTVPMPDFDDYFAALAGSGLKDDIEPGLILETSRGCWWGAVHHCTFCGLNGGSMAFRSKSADRALEEIRTVSRRHQIKRFIMADNIIDTRYFKDFLPRLAQDQEGYTFFYEIKANLRYEQLQLLHAAGVDWLQPGIESLHDEALKLMDKGVSAWQNIQVLKWSRELGIVLSWYILSGLPGEEDSWYDEMADLVPLLYHLQAPKDMVTIRFDRFSPYQQTPDKFGLNLKAIWPMRHIYPLPEEELARLTYVFEDESRARQRTSTTRLHSGQSLSKAFDTPGRARLAQATQDWTRIYTFGTRPILAMDEEAEATDLFDTRPCATDRRHRLTGLLHEVHRLCDKGRTAVSLAGDLRCDVAEVQVALDDLKTRKLLAHVGNRYLALAVRGDIPALPRRNEDGYPGGWIRVPAHL